MDVKGYDFEFVDELSPDHRCSICLLGMRNPVQTAKCGHRFCDGCLVKALRRDDERVCPLDNEPIPQEGGFFHDVAWKRDILSHRVKCKRNERGCDWIGELRDYEEHFGNTCPYEDVFCSRCNEIKQRKFLPEHATSECSNRVVQCKYCVREFEFWRTEIHEGEECNLFPLDCPQQCGISKMPREKLGFHIKDDCLMTLVTCPYSDAGCTFHDKRINLQAHIKDSTEDHLHKAWTQIAEVKEAVLKINKSEGHLKDRSRVQQFQPEKKRMEISLQRTIDETDKLKSLTTKLEKENRKIEQEVSGFTKQLSDVETSSRRNNEEINRFSALATKLEKENRRLQEDVSGLAKQLSETKTSLQIIKSGSKELMPSKTQLEEENRNLKKEVSELAKQLSDTKMSSQRNNEEINKIRPLMTQLEEENRSLRKEVSGMAKQLSDTKMSSQRNNEESKGLRPLATQLEEENRNLKKEISGLAKQLSDTKMSSTKKQRGDKQDKAVDDTA
ncbi:PREDICTED: TNF receptor-associated factor 6-like [Acropora digitifera]|uniref:TNF receptor-associated factor 6-like n=1 Tax=Acropora digitifera TaxID=70779 RepID=UPI00077A856B|nr:PREDICTED: TNF receptor-associated factor 6-like [Acropora digitifera]